MTDLEVIFLKQVERQHPEWTKEKQMFVAKRRVYWRNKILGQKNEEISVEHSNKS